MYERHCIGILAHKSRVAAARHTRLTRSTGPTSVQVQTQMRATHFACVLSHLGHRAQLANADTRICTSRHSSTALHLDFAGKHLEALARQTPFAGWHADESRRQSPLTHCALQNYSTRGLQPAPALRHCARELVAAAPPARKLHAAAQAAAAAERPFGLSFWPRPASSGRLQLSGRRGGSARSSGPEKKSLT